MLEKNKRLFFRISSSSKKDNQQAKSPVREKETGSGDGDNKALSLSFEAAKNEPVQRSPYFIRTLSSSPLGEKDQEELTSLFNQNKISSNNKFTLTKAKNDFTAISHISQEVKKMNEFLNEEKEKKLKELETTINEYWEAKIAKLQRDYELQLNKYKSKSVSNTGIDKHLVIDLTKQLEERYYQQYLLKLEEIKSNFQRIDEENKNQMIGEIVRELKPLYEEQLSQKLSLIKEELSKEIEINEIDKNENKNRNQGIFKCSNEKKEILKSDMIMTKEAEKINEALKEQYEKEKEYIHAKYGNENQELRKMLFTVEINTKERIIKEAEERFDKEYMKKEKLIEMDCKKKIDKYQMLLRENLELKRIDEDEETKRGIKEQKIEIGRLKSLYNVRLIKIEDAKQRLTKKLKDQEEIYAKQIAELQKEICMLKDFSNEKSKSPKLDSKNLKRSKSSISGRLGLMNSRANNLGNYQDKENIPIFSAHNEKKKSLFEENKTNQRLENIEAEEMQQTKENKLYKAENERIHDQVQDKTNSYTRCFNNKIRNIEILSKRNDSNRIMKTIIDTSKPPDVLYTEKSDISILPSQKKYENKEAVNTNNKISEDQDIKIFDTADIYETLMRRGSLIKNDNGIEYEKLKETIMKKYEVPKSDSKSKHEKLKDTTAGPMANGSLKNVNSSPQKDFALQKPKSSEFVMKYSKSLKNLERSSIKQNNKREEFKEKDRTINEFRSSVTANHEEKYREIVDKYLQKKQLQNQNLTDETKVNSNKGVLNLKYEEIFNINEDDDAQTKSMKRFKKAIETAIEKDNRLECKYQGREIFFLTNFISSLDIEDNEYKETLKAKFKELYDLWDAVEISYKARLKFFNEIELMFNNEAMLKRINQEIDYLRKYNEEIGEIISLLKKRNHIKGKVDIYKFEFEKYKNFYASIDEVVMNMKLMLQEYHRNKKKEIVYKDIDLSDIITLDLWEHKYLQQLETKNILWQKVKNRY